MHCFRVLKDMRGTVLKTIVKEIERLQMSRGTESSVCNRADTKHKESNNEAIAKSDGVDSKSEENEG